MRAKLCVTAVIAVLALGACSPPSALGEVEGNYDAVTADLAASLELPRTDDQDTAGLGITDEGCTYFPAVIEREAPSTFRLQDVQAQIDAVLLEHGFEESDEHRTPGGWEGVRSEDDRGATATVLGDGSMVRISVTVPVDPGDAPCETSTLE